MNEDVVPCPDPNEPVTRRILQEELSKFVTKEELREELSKQLSKLATPSDLKALEESIRSWIVPLFDPYLNNPGRLTTLESRMDEIETRTGG